MATKTFTPLGGRVSTSPSGSIVGVGTNTTLFTDTIPANTLMEGKYYPFRIDLSLTTPAINLTNLTFRISYGSSTFTILTAVPLVGGLTNGPITITGYLVGRTANTQFLTASVSQPSGLVANLSFSNSTMRTTMSVDATTSQTFSVTAQLTGVGVPSTTLTTDWILRSDY